MKLIVAGLLCAATACAVRPLPPSRMEQCRAGGVELIDERCNATGGCAKQSVRLAWNRGEGVLFGGDSTGEKELRRITAPELERLLAELSALHRVEGSKCAADRAWHAAFASHLAVRFGTVFQQLRETARGG